MKHVVTLLVIFVYFIYGCTTSDNSSSEGLAAEQTSTEDNETLLPLQKVIAKTDSKIKEENEQITQTIKEKVGTTPTTVKEVSHDAAETLHNQCPPDIVCTQVFKSQYLLIEDQNKNPVALDSYNIYYGGSVIGVKKMTDTKNGKYTLIDDNAVKIIPQKDAKITFKGFIKNKEVVNHTVTVNHDCCHITAVNGNQSIIIQL